MTIKEFRLAEQQSIWMMLKTKRALGVGLLLGLFVLISTLWWFNRRFDATRQAPLDPAAAFTSQAVQVVSPLQTPGTTKPLPLSALGPATGPLRVNPANPDFFVDNHGKAVYLAGSHTWLNLQDGVLTDPPPAFDYTGYLNFLQANHHNFFRLYVWEQSKWVAEVTTPYYFAPQPYQRTGPGTALDGKPKFDLTKFNQAYFDRLRQRVQQAGDRGIYVAVMLFNGWSIDDKVLRAGNPWPGHPYNAENNVNHIDGDLDRDDQGSEIHTLANPAVTAMQEAYVRKVIDTVNDLDNVLYEISNESNLDSTAWQYHMIHYVKDYEAGKPKQHPVGMTAQYLISGDYALLNANLFKSPADWVSPADADGYKDNPPVDHHGKVIIADTDHLWGIGGDHQWVWKSFTRGINPIFMDQYDDSYRLSGGGYAINNPNDVKLRRNLGYTVAYANRMKLAAMKPHNELASSGYCLANPAARGAEYLVYLPTGGKVTVKLSAVTGKLAIEWLNPDTGKLTDGGTVNGGGNLAFTAPFGGDAVLYIHSVP